MRCAVSVCLDAFALLAWLQDEAGADITEGFLRQAASSQDFHCFVSAINGGEVYNCPYRMRGAEEAETFWEEAWQGLIPLTIITLPLTGSTKRHG